MNKVEIIRNDAKNYKKYPYAITLDGRTKAYLTYPMLQRLKNEATQLLNIEAEERASIIRNSHSSELPIEDTRCHECGAIPDHYYPKMFTRDDEGRLHWSVFCPDCYRKYRYEHK